MVHWSELDPDDGDCTETCWRCYNVNFNVNFKTVFKIIQLCIIWWIKTLITESNVFGIGESGCVTWSVICGWWWCITDTTWKDVSQMHFQFKPEDNKHYQLMPHNSQLAVTVMSKINTPWNFSHLLKQNVNFGINLNCNKIHRQFQIDTWKRLWTSSQKKTSQWMYVTK
jgi:hypothetical protein